MYKTLVRTGALISVLVLLLLLAVAPAAAPAAARPSAQDDLVERGRYFAQITGCIGCHTPVDAETFEPQMDRMLAGGQPFDLGPLGVVVSKNLTPDPETGLGEWTDEEIRTAFTTGVSRDGLHLFPIMPYRFFNHLADEDVEAIIAFLRSVPPVENEVSRVQILPPEALPQLPVQDGVVAPPPSETEARAQYLFTAVLACSDCHTPLDPETQAPIMDMYMAGGQPYEGPWGVVYAANITPHAETGIGGWNDEDIERVMRTGVRPDGRQVVLMPFVDYAPLTEEDMAAVIYYLRNEVQPIDNEVAAPELNEGWERYTELPTAAEPVMTSPAAIIAGIVVVLLIIAGVVFLLMRRQRTGSGGADTSMP